MSKLRPKEVIERCGNNWIDMPLVFLKALLNSQFLFDYLKYETLRAEINFGIKREKSQFMWDGQFQVPDLKKMGALSGIVSEFVSLGSTKLGLEK